MIYYKLKTCSFTGHRKIAPEHQKEIAGRLKQIVEKLIWEGYCYFGTGGALGFDTLAAQCVLLLKKQYAHIKLILVLPCATQTRGWDKKDIAVYEQIKGQADKVVYISQEYFIGCMFKRNRHLVDYSSVCVAYLTQKTGGTAYTVRYAGQNGVRVINLAEDSPTVDSN